MLLCSQTLFLVFFFYHVNQGSRAGLSGRTAEFRLNRPPNYIAFSSMDRNRNRSVGQPTTTRLHHGRLDSEPVTTRCSEDMSKLHFLEDSTAIALKIVPYRFTQIASCYKGRREMRGRIREGQAGELGFSNYTTSVGCQTDYRTTSSNFQP